MGLAGATIAALFTGHISGDQFLVLATMAFVHYFKSDKDK